MILAIRTDKPEAELYLLTESEILSSKSWVAHRELAATINNNIEVLLSEAGKTYADMGAILFYSGPGSFTGLRIGAATANTLAYSLQIPIVGSGSDSWIELGRQRIISGQNDSVVIPEYGSEANITEQKR